MAPKSFVALNLSRSMPAISGTRISRPGSDSFAGILTPSGDGRVPLPPAFNPGVKRLPSPAVFAAAILFLCVFLSGAMVWAQDGDELTERGIKALEAGRADEAVEIFSKLIQGNPKASLFYYRGLGYVIKTNDALALKDFGKAISLDATQAVYYFQRGLAQLRMGQYKEAAADFTEATSMDPKNADAWTYRGRARMCIGQMREAVEDLNHAVKLEPRKSILYRFRGDALSALGNYDQAAQDYSAAIQLSPDDAVAINNRGVALANMGRTREAVEDFKQGMEIAASKPADESPPGFSGSRW